MGARRLKLRHELHDERQYESIDALKAALAIDTRAARERWSRLPV